jgi:nucleotide-binding universal stress UspA family protein
MFKTILVPLDGSDLAASALPWARAIASKTGAEVALMTAVIPYVEWDAAAEKTKWEPLEGAAVEYLESKRAALASSDTRARTVVRWGEAWKAICEAAESERADLIAMTTHGRSGLSRWALGSVADRVMHEASVPILLLHPENGSGLAPEIKRILVPVDGSDLSISVLPFVSHLATALNATVVVMNVVTPIPVAYAGMEGYVDARMLDAIEAGARVSLERAVNMVRQSGVVADPFVVRGTAADGIVDQARNVDLIVMSTHGRSGLGRWVAGSVADAVVRRSHVPCLLYRPEQIRELRRPDTHSAEPAAKGVSTRAASSGGE